MSREYPNDDPSFWSMSDKDKNVPLRSLTHPFLGMNRWEQINEIVSIYFRRWRTRLSLTKDIQIPLLCTSNTNKTDLAAYQQQNPNQTDFEAFFPTDTSCSTPVRIISEGNTRRSRVESLIFPSYVILLSDQDRWDRCDWRGGQLYPIREYSSGVTRGGHGPTALAQRGNPKLEFKILIYYFLITEWTKYP